MNKDKLIKRTERSKHPPSTISSYREGVATSDHCTAQPSSPTHTSSDWYHSWATQAVLTPAKEL